MLRDATTFNGLRAISFVGPENQEGGFGEHVAILLMEAYKNCGLNVTAENFFTSLTLARNLHEKNTTIVGIVRSHDREIPSRT